MSTRIEVNVVGLDERFWCEVVIEGFLVLKLDVQSIEEGERFAEVLKSSFKRTHTLAYNRGRNDLKKELRDLLGV